MSAKKIAIVGVKGIPAAYGGFETFVEQFVQHSTIGAKDLVVFCDKTTDRSAQVQGCRRIFVPFNANGAQGIVFDCIGLVMSGLMRRDVLLLGCNSAFMVPLMRLLGRKVHTNIGGLEWSRRKWGRFAQWYLKTMEQIAAKYSNTMIADNQKLCDYLANEYNVEASLIAYGGDHLERLPPPERAQIAPYKDAYDFNKEAYLVVARCQPDNNFETIADAFLNSERRLLIIANLGNSYGDFLQAKYRDATNIKFQNGVYDQAVLRQLRDNCKGYIHGHSAGGTNPSLVEAMFSTRPILCFDNGFNNHTTDGQALFWSDAQSLRAQIDALEARGEGAFTVFREIAKDKYEWGKITKQYEDILLK